jgi:hypothetical protein
MRILGAADVPLHVWLALIYALDNPAWEPPSDVSTSKHRPHRYTLQPSQQQQQQQQQHDADSDDEALSLAASGRSTMDSTGAGSATTAHSEASLAARSAITVSDPTEPRDVTGQTPTGISGAPGIDAPSHPLCAAVTFSLLLDPSFSVSTDAESAAKHERWRAAAYEVAAGSNKEPAGSMPAATLLVSMLSALQGPQPMLHGEDLGLLRLLTLVRQRLLIVVCVHATAEARSHALVCSCDFFHCMQL